MQPLDDYKSGMERYQQQLYRLKEFGSWFAWGRLAAIVLAIGAFWYNVHYSVILAIAISALVIAGFALLVIKDADNSSKIRNATLLIAINQLELDIAQGKYTGLFDGASFLPHTHDYAHDLDLFGPGSLFQYLNRSTSSQGNAALASWLLDESNTNLIRQRQQSVKELSAQLEWRQQFQAIGTQQVITRSTEKKLDGWLGKKDRFSTDETWRFLRYAYPLFTLSCLGLYILGYMPASIFYPALVAFLFFSLQVSKQITPEYNEVNRIEPEIDTLYQSVGWIEQASWTSDYLKNIQERFSADGAPASQAIRRFRTVLGRFDMRLNILIFIPLNAFFFWDLQIVCQLESWRKRFGKNMEGWFSALGDTEAIATLAALHFNHPSWSFPEFDNDSQGTVVAREMGHPLIPETQCVPNDFSTSGTGQITLVTGSNMAGKSTFLRSIGVNMVLAMMGAPVCAALFRLSPMRVVSSMRITDNLQENISTFYAELKKLKLIIEYSHARRKVFLLLDEILRGTNSIDRHTGSVALLRQLIKCEAAGILATHDLELATLAEELPGQIYNQHFDVAVRADELYFDYKLKPGICTSMNATILMRKIGIEL